MAVVSLGERSGATAAVGTRKLGAVLWTVQGLLALVFLFTGIMKLTAPSEMLAALLRRKPGKMSPDDGA